MILLGETAGRWLELASDRRPRGMIVTARGGNTVHHTESGVRGLCLIHELNERRCKRSFIIGAGSAGCSGAAGNAG